MNLRRVRHLRDGYALPATLLFLVFAFAAWSVLFRSSTSLLRIEQARVVRETRDLWTAPAMAEGLRLLQTGMSPSDPYSCKLELMRDGETKYILLNYERISTNRWTVSATPTDSEDPAIDAPVTFANVPVDASGLVATAYSNTQIRLTWTNVAHETGYSIERSPNGTGSWNEVGTTAADVVTFSNTGLSALTSYYYRVRAVNDAGYGGYSSVASASTLSNIPAAPTDPVLTVLGTDSIRLQWSDNSTIETAYEVQRSSNGVGWAPIDTTSADVATYTNTGLSSVKTYYYRVRATNSFGDSAWSSEESATTI
jgi:hypothetical protein